MIRRSVTLLCSLLALLAPGCVDDNTSFYISGNLAPEESDCTISTSNDMYASGIYDLDVAVSSFILNPLLNNALQNRANHLATDPNGVLIEQAEVTIEAPDGSLVPVSGDNPFTFPTSSFVPSSTTEGDVEQMWGEVIALPSGYIPDLRTYLSTSTSNAVVVAVRLLGRTNGGNEIDTGTWRYTIYLVESILGRSCAVDGQGTSNPCRLGQNAPLIVECCMSNAECDDGNECTTNACDGTTMSCTTTDVMNGVPCSSNTGTCQSGICVVP